MIARRSPLVAFVSLLLWGCGDPSIQTPPEPEADGGMADGGAPPLRDGGTMGRTVDDFSCVVEQATLVVGGTARLRAIVSFSDGQSAELSDAATWTVNPPERAAVEVLGSLVRAVGKAAGPVSIEASASGITSSPCVFTVSLPGGLDGGDGDGGTSALDAGLMEEARALWITRFSWSNESQVKGIIRRSADAGFNTLYFQIRGNGDAYYRSDLAPWAKKLTGQLGKDPGWDPLRVAIDEAHALGVELHAYFNVFSGWTATNFTTDGGVANYVCDPDGSSAVACALPEASPDGGVQHVLRAHPEWIAVNSSGKHVDTEYLWLSPGNPAVRQHLVDVADELLTRYDVDGLHLDRVRYPGTSYSHDAVSQAEYAALANPKPSYADWQRQNVTETVAGLYQVMKLRRPKAALSASVWGIYTDLMTGCNTSEGFHNYYQDSLGWMEAGVIDAINPMIYWDFGTGCTDWGDLLDTFMARANGRHVIAGMHALDDSPNGDIPQIARMAARIEYARSVGAAGTAVFASSYLEPDNTPPTTWPEVYTSFHGPMGPYQAPAVYPRMPWR